MTSHIAVLPISVSAATNGTCGDNLTWSLEDGILTISGSGPIRDYGVRSSPFYVYNSKIKKIIVENGVTKIGDFAFYGLLQCTNIELPSTINYIGEKAFQNCGIDEIYIPQNVISIGTKAFLYCSNLKRFVVDLDNNYYKSVDDVLFNKSGSILIQYPLNKPDESYDIPNGVLSINTYGFAKCKNLKHITMGNSVTNIGTYAFLECPNLISAKLSDGLRTLSDYLFSGCSKLKDVELPSKLLSINVSVFRGCKSIEIIDMPSSCTKIGRDAFYQCKSLKYLKIPTNITNIEGSSFSTCESLEFIFIPNSVTSIAEYAFSGCNALTDVYYGGSKEDWEKITIDSTNLLYLEPSTIHYSYSDSESLSAKMDSVKTLYVGEKDKIWIDVTPTNFWNIPVISWSSTNPKVVSVDQNGNITAKSKGTATIRAYILETGTENEVEKTCAVTVASRDFYDDFRYSFKNDKMPFGYGPSYRIPKERYIQAGLSEAEADQKVKWYSEKWSGNCFGMSTSSVLFYKDVLKEERYNENVHVPYNFESPKENVKLRQMIELFQALGSTLAWNFNNEIVSYIPNQLDYDNPVIMRIDGILGQHEVVIYDYTKNGDTYSFDIYDCSNFVTKLIYRNENEWYFDYVDEAAKILYQWRPTYIRFYNEILKVYNELFITGNNSTELFSLSSSLSQMQIIRPFDNLTIINSLGETSTIIDRGLSGDIDGIQMEQSTYLSEDQVYILTLPTDTYTIVGESEDIITTSVANDYIATEIVTSSSTPITISNSLTDIGIDSFDGQNYFVEYTLYDNILDEIEVTGIANEKVTVTLDDNDIIVTGAKTINSVTTISEKETTVSAEIPDGKEATIKYIEDESGNVSIQILSGNESLTDSVLLSKREQIVQPICELESGIYEESQILTFSKDEDTIIYYTTDESIPSKDNGNIYTLPIEINKSMTIKAIATKYGYLDSEVVELNYTLPDIVEPISDHKSGEYDEVISVSLRAKDNLTNIYYTLDGSDPFENGQLYTIPIVITKDTDIRAYAVKNGVISNEVEYNYIINSKLLVYLVNTPTNQEGNLISSENSASLSKINLVIEKLTEGEIQGSFIVAFYDECGRMLSVEMAEKVVSEKVDTIEILVNKNIGSAYKMKVFMWDSLNTLKPLSNAEEFHIK